MTEWPSDWVTEWPWVTLSYWVTGSFADDWPYGIFRIRLIELKLKLFKLKLKLRLNLKLSSFKMLVVSFLPWLPAWKAGCLPVTLGAVFVMFSRGCDGEGWCCDVNIPRRVTQLTYREGGRGAAINHVTSCHSVGVMSLHDCMGNISLRAAKSCKRFSQPC